MESDLVDAFTQFLGRLSEDVLAERVGFPEPIKPSSKTRFEMLLGVKEHEMHHRGQLMLIQRQLGIVPHLTPNQSFADTERVPRTPALTREEPVADPLTFGAHKLREIFRAPAIDVRPGWMCCRGAP